MTAPDSRPADGAGPEARGWPTTLRTQLAAGDPAGFEALFNGYFNRLRRYVYGYLRSWSDAEDLVHDVFLQLWRRRGWLATVRDLNAYLYHVARNHALNYLKHQRVETRWRAQATPGALTEGTGTNAPPDAERQLLASERLAALVQAVDALSPRQREIILLRWHDQASIDDIAARLGITASTVEIHITRAHKQLRKTLPHLLDS